MDSERLQKLKKLPELGIHPYPENFLNRISSIDAFKKAEKKLRDAEDIKEGFKETIRIAGRMMTFRAHGKLSFAQLQDFYGRIQISFIQGITKVKDLDEEKMSAHKFWDKMLDLGDYVGVEGELFKTNHGEVTILVKEITFLGKALHQMPEKFHGIADEDQILRQRYLDTLTNEETRKRFKFRSDVIKTIRQFMWDNNFDEVETPVLEHGATGAAAKPYYTHNNALDIDLVLRISQELPHKKIILGGFERIFEIGKAFRNEGIDPSHLPEHTHFEWYVAYWSFRENMDFVESMIKNVFKKLNLNPIVPVKDKEGSVKDVDFSKKWERIDFVELVNKDSGLNILSYKDNPNALRNDIKKKGIEFSEMDTMGYATLVDYLYKKISRPKIIGPAFLYNYPKLLQPLARVNDDNPDMVDQFQLLINGWEVVKGYSELVDPIDQKERFLEQEKEAEKGDEEAMQGDDEYIIAMEHGMPPISGVGLGLDRFITLITEQDNLRDCIFFPLMRPKRQTNLEKIKEAQELKKEDEMVGKAVDEALDSFKRTPSREEAWKLVKKYALEKSQQHLLMVERSMKALAKHFGKNEEVWGLVGLLHDIDWDLLPEGSQKHDPEKMKEILSEINMPEELVEAIISHDEQQGIEADTLLKKAIRSADEITGFISAVTKVRPDKKLETVEVKSITKKIKDKGFAANVNREHMKYCEKLLEMPLNEFIEIILPEMKEHAEEFGL